MTQLKTTAEVARLLLAAQAVEDTLASWIETGDLKQRLDGGEDVTIINVRGADEFARPLGYIAKARNIPVDALSGGCRKLPGLKASRSCWSAGLTSVPRWPHKLSIMPDSLRSTSCAGEWSNGTKPACRSCGARVKAKP
ncbi:MAG: rhodanese-like domain-containing protein [Pseudolabrys sp.]